MCALNLIGNEMLDIVLQESLLPKARVGFNDYIHIYWNVPLSTFQVLLVLYNDVQQLCSNKFTQNKFFM